MYNKDNSTLTLEKEICNLELAKKLKEFGALQSSVWYWYFSMLNNTWILERHASKTRLEKGLAYSAYTCTELGRLLSRCSKLIYYIYNDSAAIVYYDANFATQKTIEAETEAEARAKMLIYLLENKIIKPKECKF